MLNQEIIQENVNKLIKPYKNLLKKVNKEIERLENRLDMWERDNKFDNFQLYESTNELLKSIQAEQNRIENIIKIVENEI